MKTFLKSILPPLIINFLKTINDSLNVFIGNISFQFTKVEYDFEVVEFKMVCILMAMLSLPDPNSTILIPQAEHFRFPSQFAGL